MSAWIRSASIAAVAAWAMLSATAKADFFDAKKLFAACKSDDDYDRCLGYIEGIGDIIDLQDVHGARACLPSDIRGGRLVDVVVDFLERHPDEKRQEDASPVVAKALSEAFACKDPG